MKEGYIFYTRDTFSIISSIFFLFEEKNSMVYHIFSHFRINQSSNILWIKFLKFNLKIWVFQIDIQSGKTITAPMYFVEKFTKPKNPKPEDECASCLN